MELYAGKNRLSTSLFCAAIILAAAGSNSQSNSPASAKPGPRVVRASASELFVGDLKRLEPHLGMSSGCVRLDCGDPELFITLETERWQDGKKVATNKSTSRQSGLAEASISLKELPSLEGKSRYQIVTAVAGRFCSSAVTTATDAPKAIENGSRTFFKKLESPVDLPESNPVAVWAFLLYKATNPYPPDSVKNGTFEEAAKEAKWAVVLKVGWEPTRDP